MIAFLNNLWWLAVAVISITSMIVGALALFAYHDHNTFYSCLLMVIIASIYRSQDRIRNIEKAVNALREGQGS